MNHIEPEELLEKGVIQEMNRLFLHPRGMAVAVVEDDNEINASKLVILDSRDDDEGFYFAEGVISKEKKKHCRQLHEEKIVHRVNKLGYVIQDME